VFHDSNRKWHFTCVVSRSVTLYCFEHVKIYSDLFMWSKMVICAKTGVCMFSICVLSGFNYKYTIFSLPSLK